MQTKLRSWVVVVAGALLATVLTYWERNYRVPGSLAWLADALNSVYGSAFLISAIAGHTAHTDTPVLTYPVLFLLYALLFAILVGIVRWASRE